MHSIGDQKYTYPSGNLFVVPVSEQHFDPVTVAKYTWQIIYGMCSIKPKAAIPALSPFLVL